MRTRADLDGAFALLERQADEYVPDLNGETHLDDMLSEESFSAAPSRTIRRLRRAPLAALVAAAAVLALTVGVSALIGVGDSGRHTSPGGGPGNWHGAVVRSIPFQLAPSLHMKVGNISGGTGAGLNVNLFSTTEHMQFVLRPANDGSQLATGLERIRINDTTAYYSDGSGPGLDEPPAAVPVEAPSTPSEPPTYAPMLVWKYAPDAWATLIYEGMPSSKAGLVRIARGITFDGHPRPVRTPIALSHAPDGMRVTSYYASYLTDDNPAPPFDLSPGHWLFSVAYFLSHGNGVQIGSVFARDAADLRDLRSGTKFTVNGRTAHLVTLRDGLHLRLEIGGNVYIEVNEASSTPSLPRTMTRARLVAIAKTITIVDHPEQVATWLPITTALPDAN